MKLAKLKLNQHIHVCVTYEMSLWLEEFAAAQGYGSRSEVARALFREAMNRDKQAGDKTNGVRTYAGPMVT